MSRQHRKSFFLKTGFSQSQKQRILKAASRQSDSITAGLFPDPHSLIDSNPCKLFMEKIGELLAVLSSKLLIYNPVKKLSCAVNLT